ncbi:translation initiation factor IF-2-like [Mesocricetus auratus]|uniref:Translation initiation factor IF-2-like n=1 Tax=Mesocricetus auratus TaxID=10036 RepID=A0ABM2Y718_MESAU|nr:translation initiation factor IF-2-like [Mesocricetus auratus]
MLAGEGVAQVSWLLTRPARTVQVMVPAGSGSPPPMQRQPVSHPGPAGTFKRSTATSSRTPEAIHPDLSPPQANAKAGNGARRQLCGGPPPGPDPQEGGCGPRQGLPGLRGPRRRRAGPGLKGRRLPGPGRRGRLRTEARGPAQFSPPLSSRRPRSASLRAARSRHSPRAATPSQQPSAPEVASTRRPQPAACCGAGTGPIRNQVRAEEGGAAPDGSLAPPTSAPP